VCLMFDKTEDEPSGACLIIPAPNLLAEPSRPSANTGRSVNVSLSEGSSRSRFDKTWIFQRTSCSIPRHHLVETEGAESCSDNSNMNSELIKKNRSHALYLGPSS
jgi:hypothetical protein